MQTSTIDTPPGPFTVITDDDGAVVASGWTARVADLFPLMARQRDPGPITPRPDLGAVTAAVVSYMDGDVAAIDDVVVNHGGAPFIEQAWKVLRTVPPGAPVTYAELAALAGRPAAVRAAGSACARNPTALFVPCHRVLRTGGGLGGYGGGLPLKQRLLRLEGALPA